MGNQKYTPAPWSLGKFQSTIINTTVLDSDTEEAVYYGGLLIAESMRTKDALRAIACVNAMDGIEDPQKLRDTWEAIKHLELDAFNKMKSERDMLYAALEEAWPTIKSFGPGHHAFWKVRDALNACNHTDASVLDGNDKPVGPEHNV